MVLFPDFPLTVIKYFLSVFIGTSTVTFPDEIGINIIVGSLIYLSVMVPLEILCHDASNIPEAKMHKILKYRITLLPRFLR